MEYLQYYKKRKVREQPHLVLNLIINGIPSIQEIENPDGSVTKSFKPYYKWNTFNTWHSNIQVSYEESFKPYYKWNTFNTGTRARSDYSYVILSFKPYYKWNTFNTIKMKWLL